MREGAIRDNLYKLTLQINIEFALKAAGVRLRKSLTTPSLTGIACKLSIATA